MNGTERITAERVRQIGLGYGRAHDADEHGAGELLAAADCYLALVYGPDASPCFDAETYADDHWPFEPESCRRR